jgi:DNA-binding transcriptional MerR regulator
MSDLISIGEFADVSRLSVKALRHYDELGLLRPASVDPSTGYRLYGWWQVPTARVIVMLRSLEMPLSEIRDVLDATGWGRPADAAAVVAAHRRRLADRLARSEEQLTAIDALLNGRGVIEYKVEARELAPQTVIGIREEASVRRLSRTARRSSCRRRRMCMHRS